MTRWTPKTITGDLVVLYKGTLSDGDCHCDLLTYVTVNFGLVFRGVTVHLKSKEPIWDETKGLRTYGTILKGLNNRIGNDIR